MKYLDYPELELLSRALTFESAECRVFTRLEAYSCKAVSKERKLMKSIEDAYGGGSAGAISSSTGSSSSSSHHAHSLGDDDADGAMMQFNYEYLTSGAGGAMLDSPFGPLDQASARKTLFLLITTLNGAFPDHDFSLVNPADFRREESPAMVLNSLSSTLLNLRGGSGTPRSFSSLPNGYESMEASRSAGGAPGSSGSAGVQSYRTAPSTSPNTMAATIRGSSAAAAIATSGSASASGGNGGLSSLPSLGSVLDDIMAVHECEVFTFHPDLESDPHASGEPDSDEDDLGYGDDFEEEYWSGDEDHPATYADEASGGAAPGRMVSTFNERGGSSSGGGLSTRDTTPRPGASSGAEEDDEHTVSGEEDLSDEENRGSDFDDPLFDEDFSGGFKRSGGSGRKRDGAASSMSSFDAPESPRTPVSIRRDYFAFAKKDDRYLPPSGLRRPVSQDGQGNGDAMSGARQARVGEEGDEEEEVVGTMDYEESGEGMDAAYDPSVGSVLWTTYAFFYNKRLKRVLFVNVWARRNARYAESTSPSYRSGPTHLHPHSHSQHQRGPAKPVKTSGSAYASAVAVRNRMARRKKSGGTLATAAAAAAASGSAPVPSPAKRAIQKAEGNVGGASDASSLAATKAVLVGDGSPGTSVTGRRNGRKSAAVRSRTSSNSPGPSALSPFPHDADAKT